MSLGNSWPSIANISSHSMTVCRFLSLWTGLREPDAHFWLDDGMIGCWRGYRFERRTVRRDTRYFAEGVGNDLGLVAVVYRMNQTPRKGDFVAPSPHLIGLPCHVLRTGVMSFLYYFSLSSDSALYQVSARNSFDFSPLLEIPRAQESVESPDSLDRFLHDSSTCAHLTCQVLSRDR